MCNLHHKMSLWPRVLNQRELTTCYFRIDSDFFQKPALLGGPPRIVKIYLRSCSLPWPSLDVKWSYLGVPF